MLQNERDAVQDLLQENDDLKAELYELDKELNEKNKKLKVLSLNQNRREYHVHQYDRR